MRRPKLDLAKEYRALGRKIKKAEERMSAIKAQVIESGGAIETKTGRLAIEYAERRNAPSIERLQEAGWYERIKSAGLIRIAQIQILRVLPKKAA